MATWQTKQDQRAAGAEVLLSGETYVVGVDVANYVFLNEVPRSNVPSSVVLTQGGTTYTEVTGTPASATQFRVHYTGRLAGAVEFHAAAAGLIVMVTYWGAGSPLFAKDINRLQTLKLDVGGMATLSGLTVNTASAFAIAAQFGNSAANKLVILNDDGGGYVKLDASGAASAAIAMRFDTGGVEKMRISSAGNVGIGTASPTCALSVIGAAVPTYINVGSGDNVSLVGLLLGGSSFPSNGQVLYNPSTNAMSFFTSGTSRVTIDTSGYVLVNTSGNAYGSAGRGLVEINGSTDSMLGFKAAGAAVGFVSHGSGIMNVLNQAAGALQFGTSNINRWNINTAGHFVVNTDNAYDIGASGNRPRSLHLGNDASSVSMYYQTGLRHTGAGPAYFDCNAGGAANNIEFRNGNGFRTDVTITGAGHVGIGTSSPVSRLHVDIGGATVNYATIGNNNNGAVFGVAVDGSARVGSYVGNVAISFGGSASTAWAERMRINSDGTVVIGTDPGGGDLLRVGGNIRAGGAIELAYTTLAANIGQIRMYNDNRSYAYSFGVSAALAATELIWYDHNRAAVLGAIKATGALVWGSDPGGSDALRVSGGLRVDGLRLVAGQIEEVAINATSALAINYQGFASGITQFRNLDIYDGKQQNVASFTGSTKSLRVQGEISSKGGMFGPGSRSHVLQANGVGGADASIFLAGVEGVSNGFRVLWHNLSSRTRVSITDIPTTDVGLPSGTIWRNGNALNIVP